MATKKAAKLKSVKGKASKATKRDPKDDEPLGARSGEQIPIPGVESDLIPSVERRAKAHATNTDKQKIAKALFDDSKAALIEEMLAFEIRDYDRHGIHVHISEKLDVKVEIE